MDDELPDLQEVLGLSDSNSKRDFGRERGHFVKQYIHVIEYTNK